MNLYRLLLSTLMVLGASLVPCLLDFNKALAQESRSQNSPIQIGNVQVSLIQNTMIAAPMAGMVESIWVKEGDRLRSGDRIIQFDSQQIETELAAARAAFEAARMQADSDIDVRYAKRTLEVRQRELQQSEAANVNFAGAIPETEIAKLQLVVDQSRLSIEQAEHELEVSAAQAREKSAAAKIVEARLDKHTITAPKDGLVVEIKVEAGEWVEAGKPVARLISTNPIRIEGFVDGRVHGKELVGRSVQFSAATSSDVPEQKSSRKTAAENPALTGHVTFVSPEVHPVTGQARFWAEIENPDDVARAGMRGSVTISESTGHEAAGD